VGLHLASPAEPVPERLFFFWEKKIYACLMHIRQVQHPSMLFIHAY
jgi:hypothetical protein